MANAERQKAKVRRGVFAFGNAPFAFLMRPMTPAAFQALETIVGSVVLEDARTDHAAGRTLRDTPGLAPGDAGEIVRRAYAIVRHLRLLRHMAGVPGEPLSPWPAGAFAKIEAALAVLENRRLEFTPPGFAPEVARRRMETAARDFPATRFSLPDWLEAKLRPALGRRFDKVAAALLDAPPCTLRANTRRNGAEELVAALARERVTTTPVPGLPDGLVAADRHAAMNTAAFDSGLFEVQDAGSQQVAPFLSVKPGLRVIDACAGEGGKTLHLSNLMDGRGRIVALDVEPAKLVVLRSRAARADAQNIEAEPIVEGTWMKLAGTADRVLIDAPCTGTGVLRRQPETKWRLTPASVADRVALQARILDEAAFAAKPGGLVVYATCSLLSEENESQIARFLARHPGVFELEEQRRVLPGTDGDCDGFFMARLRRRE